MSAIRLCAGGPGLFRSEARGARRPQSTARLKAGQNDPGQRTEAMCSTCNAHLGQIATVEPELLSMGYQVLAISPDRPEELAKTLDKHDLTYQLLSDSDAVLAQAFGLVFRVDEPMLEKYRGFGIDLELASGRDHHMLPVPAVYIVDTTGIIRFAHWDADYKKRLKPETLLKAAGAIRSAPQPSGD